MPDFETIRVEGGRGAAPICIVAVAYNRVAPLARLLASLEAAEYGDADIDLVVSIDGSDRSDEVLAQCSKIRWPRGNYTVRRYLRNQGLRRHVLACGDLSQHHEAVIVLEDDLVVSSQFYRYVEATVAFYAGDSRVAGISLYAPQFNEMANLPFQPEVGSCSVYALQSAQSWGQVWTRSMWAEFRRWYDDSPSHLVAEADMPARIYSWPETSWKKFAMKFLAESGRTWIYPYLSHSTNFSELGLHNRVSTSLYQTPLDNAARDYLLEPLDSLVSYDAFFERSAAQLAGYLGVQGEPFVVDLYGTKPSVRGPCRLVTRRRIDRQPVGTFGLALRPHEASVAHRCPGEVFGDYRVERDERIELLNLPLRDVVAFHANLEWRDALSFGAQGLKQAIMRRLRG